MLLQNLIIQVDRPNKVVSIIGDYQLGQLTLQIISEMFRAESSIMKIHKTPDV